jgi:hypothetical protein
MMDAVSHGSGKQCLQQLGDREWITESDLSGGPGDPGGQDRGWPTPMVLSASSSLMAASGSSREA